MESSKQVGEEEARAAHAAKVAAAVGSGYCPKCGASNGVLEGKFRLCGNCGNKYEIKESV